MVHAFVMSRLDSGNNLVYPNIHFFVHFRFYTFYKAIKRTINAPLIMHVSEVSFLMCFERRFLPSIQMFYVSR